MTDKTLTVTVVGRRCVYINDYRVAGSKPYVSENLPSWSFEADINDLRYAIGRRPSSANKALKSRIEALEAALPDEIDLFRIIRKAGRSDREKAKAVYARIRQALEGSCND